MIKQEHIVGAIAGATLCLFSLQIANYLMSEQSVRFAGVGDETVLKSFASSKEREAKFPAGVWVFKTPPATATIDVLCVGAGGGGGIGKPGGSGDTKFERFVFSPGTVIDVVVGAGGQDGVPGGNSSFGNLVAYGGASGYGGDKGGDGTCRVVQVIKGEK